MFDVGDGATGNGGSGGIWSVDTDDARGASEKGLEEELAEVNSPSVGSVGDDVLNGINRPSDMILGEAGIEAETVCVDLGLVVPDE